MIKSELKPWLSLKSVQLSILYNHYEMLIRWGERMNLTGLAPGAELVQRHYCESLFFAAHLPREGVTVADIGSGAGFPGFPLAVVYPGRNVTLVESNQRKAVFLRESTRECPNIKVLRTRTEDLPVTFDWLVSRAVRVGDLLPLVPRVAPRIGLMLVEREFRAIQRHQHVAWSEPIQVPWGDHRICVYGVSREGFTWNDG